MAAATAPAQINVDDLSLDGCRSLACYEIIEQIGQGCYGEVFKAKERETGEIFALKKIRVSEADPEINIQKSLDHENIVKLKEIVIPDPDNVMEGTDAEGNQNQGGNIYMVLEYMDHDLERLALGSEFVDEIPKVKLTVPQIKCVMKQLLTGLRYCHERGVVHGDVKGANILVNNKGNLKLADFGSARLLPPDRQAISYRQSPAFDMMFASLLFSDLLDMHSNQHYDQHAKDLLDRMGRGDPSQRISAEDALKAEYFYVEPKPCEPESLGVVISQV